MYHMIGNTSGDLKYTCLLVRRGVKHETYPVHRYKGVSEEQDVDNRNAGYGILFTASTKKWEKTKNPARLAGKLGLAGILAGKAQPRLCNITIFAISGYANAAP